MAHSRSSSTSDLHVYDTPLASYSYGPPGSSSYSDTGSEPPSRRTSVAYEPEAALPPAHGGGHRTAGSVASVATTGASTGGGRRSRARAFSFLLDSSPLPPSSPAPSPGGRRPSLSSTLDDPFAGEAYDFALRAEEEDDDERVELSDSAPTGEAQQRRAYRQTFQPIVKEELWWMGFSAATVLGLTATAVVLSVVG
jgi:hypothetical protein